VVPCGLKYRCRPMRSAHLKSVSVVLACRASDSASTVSSVMDVPSRLWDEWEE
jgi:hypothetical protein